MQKVFFTLVFSVFLAGLYAPVFAQEGDNPFKSTPYPVPRFVSLSAGEAYVRSGPGSKYPVRWVFHKKGLPVEIVLEHETWRKIRDKDGAEGWVHQSLLSGRRSGFVTAEAEVSLYAKPDEDGRLLLKVEPGVLVHIEACDGDWCAVDISGYDGWMQRKFIWGVYPGENFD